MKQPMTLIAYVLALVLMSFLTSQRLSGDEKKPKFLGPPAPEEVKVFASLVGQWRTETDARPSAESKDGQKGTGQMTGQWLHNGHFLRLEGQGDVSAGRLEFTVLLTYDPNRKAYRRWAFTSSGTAAESTGTWYEATKTMTWTNRTAREVTYTVKHTIEKDRFVESHLQKRDDGTVLRDFTMTAERPKRVEK